MEPRRSSGAGTVLELDTGAYQIGDLIWLEFWMRERPGQSTADMLARHVARLAEMTIKRAREAGNELEYLGIQVQRTGDGLDGCIVFGYPGGYRKIGEPGAEDLDECMTGGHALGCRCHTGEAATRSLALAGD